MENYTNFYPTPKDLLGKITKKVRFWQLNAILEPSAGKGDIADFIKAQDSHPVVDCIEINPELRATLKGKEYPIVGEDFMSFVPQYQYDLILMNPPFDEGARHLLKALDIQKRGGRIICILNAETIRNQYTNERKVLVQKLEDYDASIEYMESEFTSAERTTSVEIAVVDVTIPEKAQTSFIFENLKEKKYKKEIEKETTDLISNDYIAAAVLHYNMEVDAGLNLIREYKALSPYIMDSLKQNDYTKPCLSLCIGDEKELTEIGYVRLLRKKYWKALFEDIRFTGAMTNNLRDNYAEQIRKLVNYDFSIANIKELQIQMCGSLVKGIEDTIMRLFDELSYEYSWSPEFSNNVHYYNGWATNKCWYINKKVILPKNAWNKIWNEMKVNDYNLISEFDDMEKAFNYLAGCPGSTVYVGSFLEEAQNEGKTKDIHCKYFDLTFYKKGTVHITFNNDELLKKLNIFGGKGKNMLPPSYGQAKYDDMSTEEQRVVNEFDGGKEAYEKIYVERDKYIVDSMKLLPQNDDMVA